MDNKDAKLTESELDSITGGDNWWKENQRRVCKGVTKLDSNCFTGISGTYCRELVLSADPNRNMQLFKYCALLEIFLE